SANWRSASRRLSASLTSNSKLSKLCRETLRITRESSTIRQCFMRHSRCFAGHNPKRVTFDLSRQAFSVSGNQGADIEEQNRAGFGFHATEGRDLPAGPGIRSKRGDIFARGDDIVRSIDEQTVEVAFMFDDNRTLPAPVGVTGGEAERGRAVDHGERAAAERGEPGDMRRAA